jgi:hypothetical protein
MQTVYGETFEPKRDNKLGSVPIFACFSSVGGPVVPILMNFREIAKSKDGN